VKACIRTTRWPQGQILRLSRYRAARIGVDVNLHTGRWSFEQAVKYFMEAGRTRPRSRRRRGGGCSVKPVAEDLLHHREVADHASARALSRQPKAPTSASAHFTTS